MDFDRMSDLHDSIAQIEAVIQSLKTGGCEPTEARRQIRDAIQNLAQIPQDTSLSLADTLEAVSSRCAQYAKRPVAQVVLRLMGETDVLPGNVFGIIEDGCPDLLSNVITDKKAQTHQKLDAAMSIHRAACNSLNHLTATFTSLSDLNGRRSTIMRALNQGPTKNYLSAFGFVSVSSTISSALSLVHRVTHSQGHDLQENLQALLDSVADDLQQYAEAQTFVVQSYLLPFLTEVQFKCLSLQATLADRFACNISVPVSPYQPEKKYPLHITASQLQVFVPLTNTGPGTAQDVLAFCISDDCSVLSEETRLGNVRPGQFVLSLLFETNEPREAIGLLVEIRWHVIGDAGIKTKDFSISVEAQRTDIDWDGLSLRQPYSLEVAAGDDFYGRKDALHSILRRLAPNAMQSCYITGQKRVGKSSLARAVESKLASAAHPGDYHLIYLECGEIRHSSGEETLKEIGVRLEEFLVESLPRSSDWTLKDYSSSLAPLSRLLEQLRKVKADTRIVVFLDEFDEINESLYRHGELANTFFLNFRTLSSKQNIAFVLIGAERMPYVMASQGEKLNRFARVSINSFDQESEWADYGNLVRKPVVDVIQYHESALYELFDITNGHPYFTKLLCATAYEHAVETKDAEVSSAEIQRAARRAVGSLDTNAFAHYWRDGIRGDLEEVEIVSLKRCRLLLAWARTARSRKSPTCDAIQANVHSVALQSAEVLPLLEDFCRRGVFRENDGIYVPTVRLFRDWLVESGFSMLVADQLGDELAEAKQALEDEAYVRADEIMDVVSDWDLYQGQKVDAEQVRSWLSQVESNVEQRLLFKLLQNLRFVRDAEVREKFSVAHSWIRKLLPVIVKTSRSQRRDDVIIAYVDGVGKSGAHYAAIYANANDMVLLR